MITVNNFESMEAYKTLKSSMNQVDKRVENISSGLRINSADDDAAGIAVSEKMRSQIGGMDTSLRNTQDRISLLQTAEGGLAQVNSILERMKELAVHASNDTLTNQDRSHVQEEVDKLRDEINKISNTTQFNKQKLLDGSMGGLWSSDDNNTRAYINGGLTSINEFGEKISTEGNYKIDLIAYDTGKTQVQKTNVMKYLEDDLNNNNNIPLPDTELININNFYDSDGTFILETSKQLTISQGNANTEINIYAHDTLKSLENKLNYAIGWDLKQNKYTDTSENFAKYIYLSESADNTSQSLSGTFVIRSAVAGKNGNLYFSGDESLLNALGLNVVQESTESIFNATISDMHNNKNIADVKITGNNLKGVINPNVDVEFNSMAGIKSKWDELSKSYKLSAEEFSTTLHLSDNTTIFHIGADKGEELLINIGDTSSTALGLDSVDVLTRETANKSVGLIDNAIDKILTQRSKIGAYTNSMEHTANNLTIMSQNLSLSQSRIRDADTAKEAIELVRAKIFEQSGTSMISQANQASKNVLQLMM